MIKVIDNRTQKSKKYHVRQKTCIKGYEVIIILNIFYTKMFFFCFFFKALSLVLNFHFQAFQCEPIEPYPYSQMI